jgi:hypothetical protein
MTTHRILLWLAFFGIANVYGQNESTSVNNKISENSESINLLLSAKDASQLEAFYNGQSLAGVQSVENVLVGEKCVVIQTTPFSGIRASRIFIYTGAQNGVLRFRDYLFVYLIDKPELKTDKDEWILLFAGKEVMRLASKIDTPTLVRGIP